MSLVVDAEPGDLRAAVATWVSMDEVEKTARRSVPDSRLRLLCRACGRTFCNRRGSAYYRLQHPRSAFDQFARLASEGLSCAALARALDVTPGTISRWLDRAAAHARAFSDEHDKVVGALELQFDELCTGPRTGFPWVYNGIEVSSRYWMAGEVGRRSRGSTRAFVLQVTSLGSEGILILSDAYPFYERELKRAFGPTCVYVQIQNNYLQDWIVRSEARVILGTPERAAELLGQSEDSKRPNTSFVERLNLFLRSSCSYLHRRTSGRVRNPARLAMAVEVIRCGYNYLRPHRVLLLGTQAKTAAMLAVSFDRVRTGGRSSPSRSAARRPYCSSVSAALASSLMRGSPLAAMRCSSGMA